MFFIHTFILHSNILHVFETCIKEYLYCINLVKIQLQYIGSSTRSLTLILKLGRISNEPIPAIFLKMQSKKFLYKEILLRKKILEVQRNLLTKCNCAACEEKREKIDLFTKILICL